MQPASPRALTTGYDSKPASAVSLPAFLEDAQRMSCLSCAFHIYVRQKMLS